jgi:hypothetical protein
MPGAFLEAPRASASDHAPNREHDDRSYHCSDQPCAFTWTVPPKSLAQPSGDKRAHNSKDRGEDEARRFVRAWMEEFRDQARHEPDDYRPNEAHSDGPPSQLGQTLSRINALAATRQSEQPTIRRARPLCYLPSVVGPAARPEVLAEGPQVPELGSTV